MKVHFHGTAENPRLVIKEPDMANQVTKLIAVALAKGYVISVHDGEEWSTCRSTDANEIYKDARGVDYTTLRFRDGVHGKVRGWVTIIWENHDEEISDYSSNPMMDALIRESV